MKKIISLAAITLMIISSLAFTSCGGVTLTGEMDENGKSVTYTVNNADKDDYVLSGTLIVTENEQILIDSNLEKGSMQFEFISSEGMDSEEEAPDADSLEAVYTANVSEVESQAVWFGAGEYMVRATVTEKAKGTVDITVKGFDEE